MKTTVSKVVLVCILISTAMVAYGQGNRDKVARIKQGEFKGLYERKSVAVVDVRTRGEYDDGHIPGAMAIPLDRIESRLSQLTILTKPIVTYCS